MGQIIINEFRRNGMFQGNEYVELLLTEDMNAAQLQSYFVGDADGSTAIKRSAYQFRNMGDIAPVFKAGTIIAIGGSSVIPTNDIAYNPVPGGTNGDWNIQLPINNGAGGTYLNNVLFSTNGFGGDFAESDIAWVDTSSSGITSIDSIAWPTTGLGALGNAAKVQIPAPNNGGNVEFYSALGGVNKTANYAVNSPGSIGLPNGGINTIYIDSLRNRQVNSAPVLDTSVNPLALFMNEDLPNANNRGINIYAYLYDVVSDPNGYPFGMAVTGVDNTNGNWQFSTNGDNTWTDFGTVSDSSATVLGPTFLYNGLVGNTPSPQGWLDLTNLNAASPTSNASEIFSGNGANLNSNAANSIYAGYSSHRALGTPLNSSFPLLDRNAGFVTVGFEISFNLQIISESRSDQNEAGFSIVVVTSDRKAIEIGFQQLSATSGRIFAKGDGITPNPGGQPNGLFLPAENIAYNTNRATNYTLSIQGDSYSLVNDGSPIFDGSTGFSGPLRDYSAFSGPIDPYETPNFLFLGDNTTEAKANINLTQVFLQSRSNPRVRFVPNPDYYSTPGNEPTITFRAWDGSNGVASGTTGVNASVTGGTTPFSTNSITSAIAVNSVNDAPSFVKGLDRTLNRNAGPQSVTGWATAIFPGPANESAQSVNFQVVGNDNTGLFSVAPAIDSLGQLTFTPATGKTGNATITINLKDSGGTANGGVDTSPNQTFRINVNNTGTFNFSAADYTVSENGNFGTITVTRTDDINGVASVDYNTSNGTANAGSDYTATSGTLNFAIGETSKTFTIEIIDDTLVEGNETVNLRLISPTNGADLGTISTAVLTIVDTTPTPTPIPTPAETPTPTPTPISAETPTPTPTPISAETPTPISAETPTPTPTPTPAETPTPTPTPISAETPTPTPTPISAETPTPISAETPTPTPTPISAETPTPTPTPISAETPTPTPTPTPISAETPTPTPTPAETLTPTPTPILRKLRRRRQFQFLRKLRRQLQLQFLRKLRHRRQLQFLRKLRLQLRLRLRRLRKLRRQFQFLRKLRLRRRHQFLRKLRRRRQLQFLRKLRHQFLRKLRRRRQLQFLRKLRHQFLRKLRRRRQLQFLRKLRRRHRLQFLRKLRHRRQRTPTPIPISAETPTPTPTPISAETPTPTPTPISAETPTPTPTPISAETPTPTPIPISAETPTPTPTPISAETPTPTPIPISAETPTPTPTSAETPIQVGVSLGAPPLQVAGETPTDFDGGNTDTFWENCICDRTILPDRTSIPAPNITENTLNTTDGKDTLTGSNFNDSINGFNGSDLLIGLEGSDHIYGGFPSNISVAPDTDSDTIFGNENHDYIIGHAGDDIIYSGKDHDLAIGGKDNDLIWGDKGNDTLLGDDGNDTIFGDTSDASDGDLTGRDLLFGDRGNDILYGKESEDSLSGGEDNDTLHGGQDNDLIFGNSGNDLLLGDLGNDSICGGEGDDTMVGDTDNIATDASSQKDYICGGSGNDLIFGNDDTDKLCGCDGNDTLHGGKGDDTLTGGIGDDWLMGDLGNDTLQGGNGRDYFVLTAGEGGHVITDFTKGEDVLILTRGLTFDGLSIVQENSATLIRIAGTDRLLAKLKGMQASAIEPQDFTII